MWFECAPDNDTPPPSSDELQTWINTLRIEQQIRNDVWHRYVLTRGNFRRMDNWLKKQWFFRNASKEQLVAIMEVMMEHISTMRNEHI